MLFVYVLCKEKTKRRRVNEQKEILVILNAKEIIVNIAFVTVFLT